jgi:glycosyltransferase involved in cell wall biosynthesis
LTDSIEISVVAPCFNEQDNIELLCDRVGKALSPLGVGFELICVDDASTDRTHEVIENAAKKFDFLVPAHHEVNQGIVGGWRTGLAESKGRYVATIDADLQYRPEDIVEMYRRIQKGDADLVQGWRESQPERGLLRKAMTGGLSVALNLIFGMKLKDNKSGFVLYTREAMEAVLTYRSNFTYFQHFITIAAHSKGYRIVQIPITFDPRNAGESFITHPFRFSVRVLLDMPKAIWEYRLSGKNRRRDLA